MLQKCQVLYIYSVLLIGLGRFCSANVTPECVKGAEGRLRLHTVPATWWDAQLRCQLEGSTLASPINGALTQAMKSMMAANKLGKGKILTGMHSTLINRDFISLEGILLSNISLPWAKRESSHLCEEKCLLLTGNGEVADTNCASNYPYFCYIHGPKMKESCSETSDSQVSNCGASDNGYELEPSTGSCYKFHKRALPRRHAAMVCAAEHAHLAVINSFLESQVLKNIFAQNPADTIQFTHLKIPFKKNQPDFAHIGVLDSNGQNNWVTIFGETLAEAGYNKWAAGEPNFPGIENCGTIGRNGLLLNDACEGTVHPFICESTRK